MTWLRGIRFPILTALLALMTPCWANGLAVSPLTLSLKPNQQMTALTVTNTGTKTLLVQGKVMNWANSTDLLGSEKASEIILTPPLFKLEPKGKQLVRVGWMRQTPPPDAEQAFRVILQEVPSPLDMSNGLKVTLAISLPLFADASSPSIHRMDLELPDLDSSPQIQLKNRGTRHQRFTYIKVIDAEQQVLLEAPQLLYVLPGQQHNLTLEKRPTAFPLQIQTTSDLGQQTQVLSAPAS